MIVVVWCVLKTLAEAIERMELSAVIAGRKPARSAAEICWKYIILNCCSLGTSPFQLWCMILI